MILAVYEQEQDLRVEYKLNMTFDNDEFREELY